VPKCGLVSVPEHANSVRPLRQQHRARSHSRPHRRGPCSCQGARQSRHLFQDASTTSCRLRSIARTAASNSTRCFPGDVSFRWWPSHMLNSQSLRSSKRSSRPSIRRMRARRQRSHNRRRRSHAHAAQTASCTIGALRILGACAHKSTSHVRFRANQTLVDTAEPRARIAARWAVVTHMSRRWRRRSASSSTPSHAGIAAGAVRELQLFSC